MIHVERRQKPPPKVLAEPDGRGARERSRAIKFYADPANQEKSFTFQAYSDPEVKQALNQLFHYKCAYCESYFGATQPVDVEHYRPKGAVWVKGKPKGRGYYWLAADWDNLLPSCIDCNRPRTQEIYGQDAQVQGKATEFPIISETKRALAPDQEKHERRLLLNPCLDHPEKHLVFEVVEGDEIVVRPALQPNGKESRMGIESIRVYALQRLGLVWARRDRMLTIKAHLVTIDQLVEWMDEEPENARVERLLQQEMKELSRLLEDDQPYTGMARQYVNRHFQRG